MGVTLLAAMTTNVRNDLKDLDSTNYLWIDTELQRHIQHAVNDYQRVYPLRASETITVVADSNGLTRRQSVGSPLPTGYLWAERVEYPIDNDPPAYLVFREELPDLGSLYLPTGDAPAAGDSLKIWYATVHTLSNSVSTLMTEHEEVITLGSVAYAAQSATRYAQHRLNASYWTPKGISDFAVEKMAEYKLALSQVASSYSSPGVPQPQWGQVDREWYRL